MNRGSGTGGRGPGKKNQESEARNRISSKIIFIATLFMVTITAPVSWAAELSFDRIEKAFMEKRYEAAAEGAGKMIDSGLGDKVELYYIKAVSELKLSRFDEARNDFGHILSRYSRSLRAFDAEIGVGDSYLLQGDAQRAAKTYEAALEKYKGNKNVPVVYHRLWKCYSKLGSDEKARLYLERLKSASPMSFEARFLSGETDLAPARYARMSEVSEKAKYCVQVGSFKSKRNADRFADKLSREGYASYVELPASQTPRLYRVKIGRYVTQKEAEELASRLDSRGYKTKVSTCGA